MLSPYLFIVGCPRSGTTLLQRIAEAHSQIAMVPELFWVTDQVRSKGGLKLKEPVTQEMISKLVMHKRFPQLGIDADEFLELYKSEATYGEFVGLIFDLYGRRSHKQFVGNKTPDYVQNIRELHEQWPSARFVHLIRDGRDVCLSIMDWKKADRTTGRYIPFSEDPVSTTALYWKRKVMLGQQVGRSLGQDLYYELRYESLIANPETQSKKLCDFLQIPYEEKMIRFYEHRPDTEKARNANSWKPVTWGLRDWHTQMHAPDLERFEAAAGDLLDGLGYERSLAQIKPDARDHAAQVLNRFTNALHSVRKPLPEGWPFAG
jgi:hypothetical protein